MLATLVAAPHDRDAHLVYADLLQRDGDPRGELIALQAKLLDTPTDAQLLARQAELFAHHGATWLGELAKLGERNFDARWELGFVRGVRLGPATSQYTTADCDLAELIEKLVALPGMELLDDIVIGAVESNAEPSWATIVNEIVRCGLPPNVRKLAFDGGSYWDISMTWLGNLEPAYPRLQRLRELRIELGGMVFGTIDLPELRALRIVTGGLTADNCKDFRTARWPQLEALMLYIGQSHNDYGCDVGFDDLDWIFAGENLANVKHLGLANSSLADDIARALVGSPILGQLETLDLSNGTLSDTGLSALLEDPRLSNLRAVDLSHSYLADQELLARVAKLGPAFDLSHLEANDDPEDRYCKVSE